MSVAASLSLLNQWKKDFPEALAQINEWQRDADIRRARLTLTEAPLSIGIMGQVKAGKSSFLNSLLFGGYSLLPEAATPKTANLTRIRYAPKPSLTVRFYQADDWALIEKQASSNLYDDTCQAARELVESAHASGEDIQKLLTKGEISLQADDMNGLMGKLNDYVGGDGRLTSLVAATELALPIDELIGIEIVDTPGMNDPVVSRTAKTREYMSQCDVVFFLTRTSQFLDASDQMLLTVQLPQKGIKRLILVGAQLDMAVLDDGFNCASLEDCHSRISRQLSKLTKRAFDSLAVQREKQGFPETATMLRQVEEPIFASTHARLIAEQPRDTWSPSVRHTHDELCELAEDSWGSPLTLADWQKLANTKALANAFAQARADKESLLAQQRANVDKELTKVLVDLLRQLRELAESRLYTLQKNDLASLETRERAEQAQLDKVSQALSGYLHEISAQMQARCHQLTEEVAQSAARASRLDERIGYQYNSHKVMISDSIWYKPWTWFSSHEESYLTASTYPYLAVSDAAENLRYYVQSAHRQMLLSFDDLIAPSTISAGLRRELLRVIDPSSPDFDPKGLRALIESSLGKLQLPVLNLAVPDTDRAFAGFSGEVNNESDMVRLREKLACAVNDINSTLLRGLNNTVVETSQTLDKIATVLHKQLTARLAEEIQQLRTAMVDKTQHIVSMQNLLKAIDTI